MEEILKVEVNTKQMLQVTKDVQIFLNKQGQANIRTKADFETAGEIRNQIRSFLKEVEEVRTQLKKPFLDGGNAIQEAAKIITDPLNKALKVIDDGMVAWSKAEEKKIAEANEKKMREAEEKAEKERLALEEQAKKAEASGDVIKANQLQEKAQEVTVAPIKLKEPTKVFGFARRKAWKAEVIDFSLLPEQYKMVNLPMLNDFARATAGTSKVPGVRFYEDDIATGSIR